MTSINIIQQKNAFIQELFEGLDGYIEIREIKDGYINKKFFENVDQAAEYEPPQDKHVYVGVFTRDNKQSGTKEDIKEAQALWLDLDNVSSLIELQYMLDMKQLPMYSMAINSGHGFHVYYILEEPAGPEVAPVLRELARRAEADPQAAEVARVMRLPGTMNVKGDPVRCKIEEQKNITYSLDSLAKKLGVTPEPDQKPHRTAQKADRAINVDYEGIRSNIDRPCIRSMMEGVKKGQRNWILGRLTMYFRNVEGFTKDKSRKLVKAWNYRNKPPQPESELMASFYSYWNGNYDLLGCKVLDKDKKVIPRLQQTLNKHCNKDKCSRAGPYKTIQDGKVAHYNNRLVKKIKKIDGWPLIIYGVLCKNPQGITADRAKEIMDITKKTFSKHANKLIQLGFCRKKKGIKSRGISDLYYLKRQGTFGTGRTPINYGTVLLAANKVIKPAHFRVYLMLKWYKFMGRNGQLNPSTTTLGEKLDLDRSMVSRYIGKLEKKDLVSVDRSGYSNKYDLTFKLE